MSLAAVAVDRVRGGQSLPHALDLVSQQAQLADPAHASVRGAVQDLAYRTLRGLGRAQAVLRELVVRPPAARVDALLTVALALLLDDEPPYTEFTIVDQAVRAAAADPRTAQARGMVNAVLRRLQRERASIDATLADDVTATWNYPEWWVQVVRDAWPDTWESILRVGNTRPPLTLRVNTARLSVADYLQQLTARELSGRQIGPQAVRLDTPVAVSRIPGFADGLVSVQDAGAQLAASLLDLQAGQRVLDACAAPGGKSGHILELAPVALTALDSDARRLSRIEENLQRLGVTAKVLAGDAGQPETWWDGQPFDRILADVPCSASGIVRRHPDIRWLRRPNDVTQLQAVQRRIVQALWNTLAPGGKLLYVTCSIFPTEGDLQAQWFESHLKDAIRLQAPGQLLPACESKQLASKPYDSTLHSPAQVDGAPENAIREGAALDAEGAALNGPTEDHDGFYYALFQKRC